MLKAFAKLISPEIVPDDCATYSFYCSSQMDCNRLYGVQGKFKRCYNERGTLTSTEWYDCCY